jgi:hypothetical protein
MIDNNRGIFLHQFRSPENDVVILERVGEFLDPRDAGRCELVCTTFFRVFSQDQEMWTQLSLKEGIPFVAGPNRDRRKDFQTLFPLTLSGARISQIIGKVRGPIPRIREVVFNKLNDPDPFEPNKCMKDTWVFVVVPSGVTRTAGPQTPLDFDNKGNLVEVPEDQVQHGKELVISLSLKNLKLVCVYSLKGRENLVFNQGIDNEVFDQCGVSSEDGTRVHLMRRCIVEKSRELCYSDQKKLVEQCGFGITPTRIRALFHAVVILESRTCSDGNNPQLSFARSPDLVRIRNNSHFVCIGGFATHLGMSVFLTTDGHRTIGVAPCIPADVT